VEPDEGLTGRGLGPGGIGDLEDVGIAETVDDNCSHFKLLRVSAA
jgi:hypothetical protein